jgi:transposase
VSNARLVITAVTVEHRPVAEVASEYAVSRQWIYKLLARYRAEGDASCSTRGCLRSAHQAWSSTSTAAGAGLSSMGHIW